MSHKVLKGFESLTSVFENDKYPIIEYKGEFYWIGEEECPFDAEDTKLESEVVPAFRRSIGVQESNPNPYITKYEEGYEYNDGVVNHPDGFLPNSNKKIYKIMTTELPPAPFLIPRYADDQLDEDVVVCIKNGCDNCEFKSECKPRLHEVDFNGKGTMQIVVMDISSQEPVIAAAVAHKEPRWLETFRNRSQRELLLDVFLNVIVEEEFGMNVSHASSYRYWEYLEKIYFDNELLSKLINMNNLFYKMRANQLNEDDRFNLNELVDFFISDFGKFK